MNETDPSDDSTDTAESSVRSLATWIAQYVFWVLIIFAVVAFTWFSASGSSAFRYAGF